MERVEIGRSLLIVVEVSADQIVLMIVFVSRDRVVQLLLEVNVKL